MMEWRCSLMWPWQSAEPSSLLSNARCTMCCSCDELLHLGWLPCQCSAEILSMPWLKWMQFWRLFFMLCCCRNLACRENGVQLSFTCMRSCCYANSIQFAHTHTHVWWHFVRDKPIHTLEECELATGHVAQLCCASSTATKLHTSGIGK